MEELALALVWLSALSPGFALLEKKQVKDNRQKSFTFRRASHLELNFSLEDLGALWKT